MRQDANLTSGIVPEDKVLGLPFATCSHPMWVFDRVTRFFLDVNAVAVKQYGYSRQEFLTMTILDIRPPSDIPLVLRKTPSPRLLGPSTAEAWNHQAKDGSVFPVAITSWELNFHGRPAELVLATSA
jgi:PAS domain S-box-containing protein